MINKNEHNVMLKTTGLLVVPLLFMAASSILSCDADGHINFHNHTFIPLKLIIKTLPELTINCVASSPGSWSRVQKDTCDKASLNYNEYTIDVPGKGGSTMGKKDGVCWVNDGLYMVSYRVILKDGANDREGPTGNVISFRKSSLGNFAGIKHGGDSSYLKPSGCGPKSAYSVCTVVFREVL